MDRPAWVVEIMDRHRGLAYKKVTQGLTEAEAEELQVVRWLLDLWRASRETPKP